MGKYYQSGFEKSYLKKPANQFIREYDVEFNTLTESDISLGFTLRNENIENERLEVNFIFSNEYEINVLDNAYDYLLKYRWISYKLVGRYLDISSPNYNQQKANLYIAEHQQAQSKLLFLDRKLGELGQDIKISNVLQNTKPSPKKNNLLIDGKKPNISERYRIADETLNLFDTINKKNISATDKHILLAHILGCSQQTARELFNGTQLKRTPVREELINDYLKKLK